MNRTAGRLTPAEKRAIKAHEEDLIKQGIGKEMAKTMAKIDFEYGIIKVVVNGN